MNLANSANHNFKAPNIRHRAEVAPDGSVTLIADTPSMAVSIDEPGAGEASVIELDAQEFERLHELGAPTDKSLTYDRTKKKFGTRKLR